MCGSNSRLIIANPARLSECVLIMPSYVQASSNSAPPASVMAANSTGHRMDTGTGTAAELDATRMAYQQAYANPVQFQQELHRAAGADAVGTAFTAAERVPAGYNTSGPYPAKYSMPTPAKERIVARNALRQTAPTPTSGAGGQGTLMVDSVTEDEVDYLQGMNRQAELADYDRYVSTLVDPRQPGQLRWLYEVYPDFVHRRIAQVQQDFDFAIKNKLIDMWGINSKEDLDFKYMVDQGKIDGPILQRPPPPYDNLYKAGMLSPWNYMRGREEGIAMPFASATMGPKPNRPNDWMMADKVTDRSGAEVYQPLSTQRGIEQMATAYWGKDNGSGAMSDARVRGRAMGSQNAEPYGGNRPFDGAFPQGQGPTRDFRPAVS